MATKRHEDDTPNEPLELEADESAAGEHDSGDEPAPDAEPEGDAGDGDEPAGDAEEGDEPEPEAEPVGRLHFIDGVPHFGIVPPTDEAVAAQAPPTGGEE